MSKSLEIPPSMIKIQEWCLLDHVRIEASLDLINIHFRQIGRELIALGIGHHLVDIKVIGCTDKVIVDHLANIHISLQLTNAANGLEVGFPAPPIVITPTLSLIHVATEDICQLEHRLCSKVGAQVALHDG